MKSFPFLKLLALGMLLLFMVSCATAPTPTPTTPPGQAVSPAVKPSVIQRITVLEEETYTRIRIEGSESIPPPFYKLISDPLRIAIDLPNADLSQIRETLKVNNGTVGEIQGTQYDDKGRIEISLLQMTNYNISKEERNILIDVEKVKKVVEVKEAKPEGRMSQGEKEEGVKPPEPKKEETLPPPVVSTPTPPPLNKAKEIINFQFEDQKDVLVFHIIADGQLGNYNSFKLDSPPRLVLDLWDVETRYPQRSLKIKGPFIKEVRIGQHPDKLRLVFDSSKPQMSPYQINRTENRLMVRIGNVPTTLQPQISVEEKVLEAPPKPTETSTVAQAPTPPKATKPNILKEINFKQMDNKSRVMVSLSEEPKFETRLISKNTVALDIKDSFAPKHLRRGLDTKEFDSAVSYISIQNIKVGKRNDLRILIKLKEEVPYETTQEGANLFVDIERPKRVETKVEPPPIPPQEVVEVKEVKKEKEPPPEPKKEEKPPISPVPSPPAPAPVAKKGEPGKLLEEAPLERVYTGRKVSLDFKDADIKNILRLIAEVSDLNIIAGDDVTGKITMRLVDVPWDQALDVILQARALGMHRVGNVIRVAPLETLKKEVQAELEAKRAKERLEDLVTELIPINYASGKEIIPQVKGILSERGDVKVDERTNILIIKDIPRNIVAVKNLVKSLDTKTPMVMIEARIVEANLSFQRELGVQWGFQATAGTKRNLTFGGGIGGLVQGTPVTNVISLPAIARTAVPGGVATAGVLEFLLTTVYGLRQLDVAISAHENKGDVRVISSPKIATLDNKEASIEQGLRIPYRKLTTEGTVTTDFIDANLKLTVTPHVTNDGHIKMNIKAKRDAPSNEVVVEGTPSIDKKEAITEVLVKDGAVVAIGGVYSIEKTEGTEGIPLFSKIPLLGWLFKRSTNDDRRRDLLIFISPRIIKDT